ncbi:hypothetical protein ACIBEJ_34520 [Nonomuraea sp. NPDC050790]|uniref:hypothetical protein n=1 Tax=Nonomuraea sp. NPDC050790 TaxID=3364371 RepID=UPI0037B957D9
MSGNCWILERPDGSLFSGDWPAITHFETDNKARERASRLVSAGWTPRRLGHTCVVVKCGQCGDTFDGGTAYHFDSLDEAVAELEGCGDWARLSDGSFRCGLCRSQQAGAVQEVLAS